jgi:hypothetical protein
MSGCGLVSVLVGNLEGKRAIERLGCKWKLDIKLDFKEM